MTNKQWSKSWKNSRKPSKQRKYRRNAPLHQRHKLLKAKLSDKWQDKLSFSSLPLREGDQVKVMRGDHRGERGEVAKVDYDDLTVELEDLKREKVDGSDVKIALQPSNLVITRPNLDDELRAKRVEEIKEIKQEMAEEEEAEKEVAEEAEEEQEEQELEEELEEKEQELEEQLEAKEEELEEEMEVRSLVNDTIDDIKSEVEDYERKLAEDDQGKLLKILKEIKEAEEDNKARKTLLNYLEGKIDEYTA